MDSKIENELARHTELKRWIPLQIIIIPWVYSSQGLKAIRTVLVWLLVRIVVEQEGVVQKKCNFKIRFKNLQIFRENSLRGRGLPVEY